MSQASSLVHAPLISVALCTYNGSRYLREQLDSLARQTYPRLEIVAVDDVSADDTWQILQEYAGRLPMKIYRNETNLGYIRNFEKAMSLCRGTFIAPCDQDDVWLPEKLEKLAARCQGQLLVYCDSELIDAQGHSLHQRASAKVNPIGSARPNALLFSNCASGHAMLFRRELLAPALPFPGQVAHDWWLMYAAASLGSIAYLPEALVQYRQHPANVTNFSQHKNQQQTDPRPLRRRRQLELLRQFQGFNNRQGLANPVLNQLIGLLEQQKEKGLDLDLLTFLLRHRGELYFILKKSRLQKIHRIFKESLA